MKTKGSFVKILGLALSVIAMMCAVAVADEQKYDESTPLAEVQAAAHEGNTEAMIVYGMRLMQGEDLEANATAGLEWINKAADAGDTQANYALGVAYLNGIGVEPDVNKAIEYLRTGAAANNVECQISLGMIYEAGDRIPGGVNADGEEAVKWYRMAAEQDSPEAIWHLAKILGRGIGVEQNDEKALVWFRRGAELGNADCMWGLGRCYLKGTAVEVDSVMAYALWAACLDGIRFPQQKKAIESELDELGKALNAEQLAQAKPIIKEWKEKVEK